MPSISFDINIVTKKAYDIIIKGFTPSDSWFVQIIQKFPITFASKVNKKFNITMSALINVAYNIKFNEYLTLPNLRGGRRVNTFSMKFKEYITKTISQISVFTLVWKENSKVTTAITNFNFSASMSPILAVFFTLGDWDASTLGTLDTDTLLDLDYTAT